MAKLSIVAGTTSKLIDVFIQDSSSTTGAGLTGLTNASSGLTWYYYREGAASSTQVTSIASMTLGTWTSKGFIVIDGTNMPGCYQLGVPDAAIAAGAKSVVMLLKGVTNMAPLVLEIELTATDNQTAALTAAQIATGVWQDTTAGDFTVSASIGKSIMNGVSLGTGLTVNDITTKTGFSLSQSFPSNFSSLAITVGGAVTAGTVSDKSGYSLSQTFPSNFSSLAITAGGAVTAGTVSDKSGYSLSQSFPTNFSSLSIDSSGRVDVIKVNGQSQTARDLGANLDTTVSSRSSHTAADVWAVDTRVLTAGTNIALAKGTGVTGFNDIAATDVWAVGTRVLTAGTNIALAKGTGVTGFNDLDAGGIRSAVGLASANLDSQLAAISSGTLTAADIRSAIGMASANLDTQLAAQTAYLVTINGNVSSLTNPYGIGTLPSGWSFT